MEFNRDTLATVTGYGLAVLNSLQTVITQVQPGTSLHAADYVNIVVSLLLIFTGHKSAFKG